MTRAIRISAFAALALFALPSDLASGGSINKSVATSCQGGLLAPGKCQVVRCVGSNCSSVVLPRATARRVRISLNQCITSHDACVSNCFLSVQHKPPYARTSRIVRTDAMPTTMRALTLHWTLEGNDLTSPSLYLLPSRTSGNSAELRGLIHRINRARPAFQALARRGRSVPVIGEAALRRPSGSRAL